MVYRGQVHLLPFECKAMNQCAKSTVNYWKYVHSHDSFPSLSLLARSPLVFQKCLTLFWIYFSESLFDFASGILALPIFRWYIHWIDRSYSFQWSCPLDLPQEWFLSSLEQITDTFIAISFTNAHSSYSPADRLRPGRFQTTGLLWWAYNSSYVFSKFVCLESSY
jgi:hypothetical protein